MDGSSGEVRLEIELESTLGVVDVEIRLVSFDGGEQIVLLV